MLALMPLRLLVCLLLALAACAVAQSASYTVQPGDTLTRIARTLGVSVDELAAANGLSDPNRLAVGQQLTLPSVQAWDEPLPPPFAAASLTPQVAVQGRVQRLSLRLEPGSSLEAVTYLGRSLPVHATEEGYEALLSTPVLQDASLQSLLLVARPAGGEAPVTVALPVEVEAGDYAREQLTLSPEASRLLAPEIVSREHALLEATCAAFEPVQRWQGAFRYPVAEPEFTSVFGTLRSYNGGPYSGFHRGLDFRAQVGTPVYAAADGVVAFSGELELYGGTVILDHGLGVCSAYMHLSERAVAEGEALGAGDLLGLAGATGLVTGPHLHWEVRVGGVPVAPLQWTEGW